MKKVSFRNDVLPLKDILYRLALRITLNKSEAEDIVQDTMIQLWKRRDSWDAIDSIEAFSLKICRNLSLDHLRKKDNNNLSIEQSKAEQRSDTAASPLDIALRNERIEAIRRMVDALPEKQKSCMQLRDFEGKRYKEIAEVLDISEEQVKISIFRARQSIKKKLQQLDKYGL